MYILPQSAARPANSAQQARLLDVIPTGNATQRLVIEQQDGEAGLQLVLVQESLRRTVIGFLGAQW